MGVSSRNLESAVLTSPVYVFVICLSLPDGDGVANEAEDSEGGADDALRPQHAGGGHVGREVYLHPHHLIHMMK